MIFDEAEDRMILNSGNSFWCSNGVLGLGQTKHGYTEAYYGYDMPLDDEDLTPEERHEVADYMKVLWETWANERRD